MENRLNFEDMDSLRLTPEECRFPNPQMLKRSEMEGLDASLWEELCIAAAEGDEDIFSDTQQFTDQVTHLRRLYLKADESIKFEGKNALRRRATLAPSLRIITAVAASVAIVLTITMFMRNADFTADDSNALTQVTHKNHQPKQAEDVVTHDAPKAEVLNTENKSTVNRPIHNSPSPISEPTAEPKTDNTELTDSHTEPIAASMQLAAMQENKLSDKEIEMEISGHSKSLIFTQENESISPLMELAHNNIINKIEPGITRQYSNSVTSLSRISEKGILAINKLLNRQTTVIRQYDNKGNLITYAVQSKTLNFERQYGR